MTREQMKETINQGVSDLRAALYDELVGSGGFGRFEGGSAEQDAQFYETLEEVLREHLIEVSNDNVKGNSRYEGS